MTMTIPKSGKYIAFGPEDRPELDVTKSEGVITRRMDSFRDKSEMKSYIKAFKQITRPIKACKIKIKKPSKSDPVLRLWSSTGITRYDVERQMRK